MTTVLRWAGILLGGMYFYWGFSTWETASRTSHPILGLSLTFLYGILLVAPWTYLARLRVWIGLYVLFVVFSLWMILAHLVGFIATVTHPQLATAGLFVMLVVEIAQIPVLWQIRKSRKGRGP